MDLAFARYTLSNGMTLIVKENHFTQSVVVRGQFQGGSNLDPVDQPGLANFTATLMRRGTARRTFADINDTIETMAASVYVNTGRHLTGFGGKCLAEDFDLWVEIMADILLQPSFPPAEVAKVRGQIITSLKEAEDNPRSMAGRYFRELLYTANHPYGRPTMGSLASIPSLTREHLVNFYRQTFHPQGGGVVVVGDVTANQVYDALEAHLGRWQPGHLPPDTTLPDPHPLTAPQRHIHRMPNKSQVDLVLGQMGPRRQADDYYAAEIGDTILGQLGLGGRIGTSVRDREGMAYYARSSLGSSPGRSPWLIYAGVNPDSVEKTIDLILNEVNRFREQPVADQELADAKAYLTGVLPLQMETNEGIAAMLLEIVLYQLEDDFIARYPGIIQKIGPAEVQAAAQKYLSEQVYALAIAGPYPTES